MRNLNGLEILPFIWIQPAPLPAKMERVWLELWPGDEFQADAAACSPQPGIPKEQSMNQFMGLPIIGVRYLGEPATIFASVCQRIKDGNVGAIKLDSGGWLWTMLKPGHEPG